METKINRLIKPNEIFLYVLHYEWGVKEQSNFRGIKNRSKNRSMMKNQQMIYMTESIIKMSLMKFKVFVHRVSSSIAFS